MAERDPPTLGTISRVYIHTAEPLKRRKKEKKKRHIFMFIINIRQEEKELLHPY